MQIVVEIERIKNFNQRTLNIKHITYMLILKHDSFETNNYFHLNHFFLFFRDFGNKF